MKEYRKNAIAVGICFIIGTASGVSSKIVTTPIANATDSLGMIANHEQLWIISSLLVLLMGLALSMIPVILYPILRKQSEIFALGAVLFRGALEAALYILFVVVQFIILSLGQTALTTNPADQAGMIALGNSLLASVSWIDLLVAVVFSIGSLMLNGLFYQMRILPRWLSGWGFVGSVLYFAAALISLLGTQHIAFSFDTALGVLIAPLALQEMVIAVWLIIKGFNPSPKLAVS